MKNDNVPLVSRASNPRVVIEQHTDRPVRQLEPKSVLVAVIDPFGDEQRLRASSRSGVTTRICKKKKKFRLRIQLNNNTK